MTATFHEKALGPPFITVEGIPNFRDLGGHGLATPTTHSVRQGIVYRCGEPQNVTENGITTMQELGITHIYDLRSADELKKNAAAGRGRVVEWEGCQRVFAPVFLEQDYSPEIIAEQLATRFRDYASKGTEGFTRAYADILENAPNSYRTVLLHLADEPSKPLIIHCTAGKDRTGVLCALILSLCGVDDGIVAREYSLTEFGLPQEWKAEIIKHLMEHPAIKDDHEGAANLISSKAENMLSTLRMLHEKFGGAEGLPAYDWNCQRLLNYMRYGYSISSTCFSRLTRNQTNQISSRRISPLPLDDIDLAASSLTGMAGLKQYHIYLYMCWAKSLAHVLESNSSSAKAAGIAQLIANTALDTPADKILHVSDVRVSWVLLRHRLP